MELKNFIVAVFILLPLGLSAMSLDYTIDNEQFVTSEGVIPSGCFAQLMTELNGDNTVAAVFINRNSFRGCIDSNFPYPGGNEDEITYEILAKLENHKYDLRVCESMRESSMGQTCDNITVQFVNRIYTTAKKCLTVLTIEKVGEW